MGLGLLFEEKALGKFPGFSLWDIEKALRAQKFLLLLATPVFVASTLHWLRTPKLRGLFLLVSFPPDGGCRKSFFLSLQASLPNRGRDFLLPWNTPQILLVYL